MGLVSTRHGSRHRGRPLARARRPRALTMVMGSLGKDDPRGTSSSRRCSGAPRPRLGGGRARRGAPRTGPRRPPRPRLEAEGARRRCPRFARGDLAIQRVIVRAAKNVGFRLILNVRPLPRGKQPAAPGEALRPPGGRSRSTRCSSSSLKLGDGEQTRQTLRAMFQRGRRRLADAPRLRREAFQKKEAQKHAERAEAVRRRKRRSALDDFPAPAYMLRLSPCRDSSTVEQRFRKAQVVGSSPTRGSERTTKDGSLPGWPFSFWTSCGLRGARRAP